MSASFRLTGVEAMRANLASVAANVRKAMARAIYQEGESVIAEAKERVPVDLGVLKSSGFTEPPVWEGNTVSVTVGFGGAASAYAAAVHEHIGIGSAAPGVGGEVGLSDFDPPSWKIAEARGTGVHFGTGGPKYLESVLHEHRPTFAQRMGAQVRDDLAA